jgi:hypothetical protein
MISFGAPPENGTRATITNRDLDRTASQDGDPGPQSLNTDDMAPEQALAHPIPHWRHGVGLDCVPL